MNLNSLKYHSFDHHFNYFFIIINLHHHFPKSIFSSFSFHLLPMIRRLYLHHCSLPNYLVHRYYLSLFYCFCVFIFSFFYHFYLQILSHQAYLNLSLYFVQKTILIHLFFIFYDFLII